MGLRPQAEEIIAEEQAGFRTGRSTAEQIFNLRILCERYLQHQQNLYHVFVDFKKVFDRVWYAAHWGDNEPLQYQRLHHPRHTEPLRPNQQCRLPQRGHWRMIPNHSCGKTKMSALTDSLQYFP